MEKISVCIATYNGELYIEDQLDSILKQLRPNDEIIISDDSSTDRTIEIIKALRDTRIKIFHSSHRNLILNFENAIEKASGDIIFLSDQDDIWYPNKVEILLNKLENYDLIFTNLNIFNENIKNSQAMFPVDKDYNNVFQNFVKNHCVGATMAFKAHLLKYALPIPKNIEMHDMWIYLIGATYGKTFYYRQPLIYYRRHDSNASNTGGKTTNSLLEIIKIRITWIKVLLKRMEKIRKHNKNIK
ncbi:glycosyltransferase family 2 protein [Cellulophaga sp. Z1A5H]|uniref:glycosyltransferase family 2 protein n=1 Tax=Cellulophaga sp. Z1A5H TaxID=2687291 RepID=UPI0013FD5C49|nr:glycosyltransferase family 2 protein [Cellulophaga sp. Z1A5H]